MQIKIEMFETEAGWLPGFVVIDIDIVGCSRCRCRLRPSRVLCVLSWELRIHGSGLQNGERDVECARAFLLEGESWFLAQQRLAGESKQIHQRMHILRQGCSFWFAFIACESMSLWYPWFAAQLTHWDRHYNGMINSLINSYSLGVCID